MTGSTRTNWRDVMAEVERRIYTREWQPGQSIPNEADLAIELGCARVTVNRALRTLAEIGLLDQIAEIFGIGSHNWLGITSTVLPAIMVMTVWKEAGFFMIFYLAGLQTISPELGEAAELEGSSRWNYFWRVQFPLLMPTTLFVLINAFLNSFKLVDHLFVLTKGGPDNASNLILYYIYETAFSFLDISYASALTVFLLFLLAITALAQFYFVDKRVHYR